MKRFLLSVIIFLLCFSVVQAKTEKFGTWIELTFIKKFLKKFEFSIIPEFRLQDNFTLDEYNIDGKLGYEPFKFLDLAASYRYNTNVKKNGNEVSHKFMADATGKVGFGRFDASLRTRFTNDAEGGNIDWGNIYFRPRAKLTYNIKGVKIEPFLSYELFWDLQHNEINKARFDAGVSRKINKYHEVGLYYRLQDYFLVSNSIQNSIHILGINYGFKF